MSKLYRSELSALLKGIAEALDIPEYRYSQAESRYQSIGQWLSREGSVVATYSPQIYPQGSFRLGTVIKPFGKEDDYDIDLVCELRLSKGKLSQSELKELVGKEIKSYAHGTNMNSEPEEGKRCWTLNYADGAQFHLDILPAIPDGESFKLLLESKGHTSSWSEHAIAITDNTLDNYHYINWEWPRSNPKGYAEWFRSRMRTQFDLQKMIFAESTRARVEEVPDYKIKTPLQRAIQLLKRHRDIMFKDQDDKPISIIISTLAGLSYNNEADLLEALVSIVNGMPRHVQNLGGVAWVTNPVNPLENFADKWEPNNNLEKNFRRWLVQVNRDITELLKHSDIQSASDLLRCLFGEKVVNENLQIDTEKGASKLAKMLAAFTNLPSRFNVPHRQFLKWPEMLVGQVSVSAWAEEAGFRPKQIYSDDSPLKKKVSVRFEARTNVIHPYKVYWQVVNTGYEANLARDLRGEFSEGLVERGRLERVENTKYSGVHCVECFIIKEGKCVARSGEFVVNIK